jgi:hypothetical protein
VFLSFTIEKPTLLDHTFYNVDAGESIIEFEIPEPNPPFLYIGIQGQSISETQFTLTLCSLNSLTTEKTIIEKTSPGPDFQLCVNCETWIPLKTFPMHQAFCERNNAKCKICHKVMKKIEFEAHWHCDVAECTAVS